jgi:peptide/nickel transport system permease protein
MLKVGAGIVIVAALLALVGPALTPFDPSAQELSLRLAGPTWSHPFGLDELGRDILARVLAGARISFYVGLVVVSISAVVGTALGSIAGYFGGAIDDAISRLIDMLLAFPGLLLAIAIVAVLGPSLVNVLFALTIIGWVGYARLIAGQVLRAREFEYVQAARALGAGLLELWRHVIPTAIPVVVVQARPWRHGRSDPGRGARSASWASAAAHAELGDHAEMAAAPTCWKPPFDTVSRPAIRCSCWDSISCRGRLEEPHRSKAREPSEHSFRFHFGVVDS